MKALVAMLFIGVLFFGSRGAEGSTPTKSAYRWPAELVSGNNRFALDLYHQLGAAADKPLFFSPYSISTALAMTYAGARGETATEMAKTLHFTLPTDQLQCRLWHGVETIDGRRAGPRLSIPHRQSALGPTGLQVSRFVSENHARRLRRRIGPTQFRPASPSQPARRSMLGSSKQTNDKIKDLIPAGSLTADTRLVLTNAIYFKGDWQLPFDKDLTQKDAVSFDGREIGRRRYDVSAKAFSFRPHRRCLQLLEMPYQSGDLSMVVLLPAKVDGLPALEKSFIADNYRSWIGRSQARMCGCGFRNSPPRKNSSSPRRSRPWACPPPFRPRAPISRPWMASAICLSRP